MADPGLITRIRERSDAGAVAVFERHGLLDVAVPVILRVRDGEDA